MATPGDQERGQAETQARTWLSMLLRKILVPLVVDILVELWRRTRGDPAFSKRIQDSFAALDGAATQEENDAAALALQRAIES